VGRVIRNGECFGQTDIIIHLGPKLAFLIIDGTQPETFLELQIGYLLMLCLLLGPTRKPPR
jgi:hypothetical protein